MDKKRIEGTLKLSAVGIGSDDMNRLAAFLRIGSEDLVHPWCLVAEGEACDVLMLDSEKPVPDINIGATPVLRLAGIDGCRGEAGELCSPLTFEALVAQLARIEHAWAENIAERVRSGDAELQATQPMAFVWYTSPAPLPDEPLAVATRLDPELPPTVPMPLRDSGASADAGPALRPGDLYRLGCSPKAAVLAGDRKLSTVASLLTLRSVKVEELVARSGLDRATCEACLLRLQALGCLTVIDATLESARKRSAPASARSPSARPLPEDRGSVIAKWRDRLGMGR